MAFIDVTQLAKSLKTTVKSMEPLAYGTALRIFEKRRRDFLDEEFDDHPVVRELGGPSPEANETTLLGYGNLFSLLGFNKGTDLVTPLREQILKKTTLRRQPVIKDKGTWTFNFRFPVEFPTMSEMEEKAPHPPDWDSRPWIRILEEGIPGFAFYLYKSEGIGTSASRSTTAIQVDKKTGGKPIRLDSVGEIPFMSNIFNRLERWFQ